MAYSSVKAMLNVSRQNNQPLWDVILQSDLLESGLTRPQSLAEMHHLWQVMQATSREYDPAQRSRSGLSGGDADLKALCTIDITDLQKAALDALS